MAASISVSSPCLSPRQAFSCFRAKSSHLRLGPTHTPRNSRVSISVCKAASSSSSSSSAVVFRNLDADEFRHPLDRQNTLILRAIPGLDQIGKALLGSIAEQVMYLENIGTSLLVSKDQASSFGGSNIDPTAWEDKKCKGESRFPAQVRIRIRKLCKALEEDSFRPVLHHYDGPKFRLELSVLETLELLDLCEQAGV